MASLEANQHSSGNPYGFHIGNMGREVIPGLLQPMPMLGEKPSELAERPLTTVELELLAGEAAWLQGVRVEESGMAIAGLIETLRVRMADDTSPRSPESIEGLAGEALASLDTDMQRARQYRNWVARNQLRTQ